MRHVPKAEEKSEAGARAGRHKAGPEPVEDDAVLVQRAQAGDVGAYEQLVRRHQRRVFAIVGGVLRRQEDVEDVAQQVFVKVFLALGRFDRRSTFTTWLYKIAVNECWDHLRKKRARPLVYQSDLSEEQARQLEGLLEQEGAPAPDARQRAEQRQLLDRLLAELSKEEQLMLVLKEVEGFSVEEVGEVLGMNVNTVKVRLFRARGRLMEVYRRRLAARRKTSGTKAREAR